MPDFPFTADRLLDQLTGGILADDIDDGEDGLVFSNVRDCDGPVPLAEVGITQYGEGDITTGSAAYFVTTFREAAEGQERATLELLAGIAADELCGPSVRFGEMPGTEEAPTYANGGEPARFTLRTADGRWVAVVIGYLDDETA